MDTSYILERYNSGEITLEEANAELAAAGARFNLKMLTEEELSEKNARENEEGIIDIGKKPEHLPARPDMSRRMDLAGLTVVQKTKSGYYALFYDNDGYATLARRVEL